MFEIRIDNDKLILVGDDDTPPTKLYRNPKQFKLLGIHVGLIDGKRYTWVYIYCSPRIQIQKNILNDANSPNVFYATYPMFIFEHLRKVCIKLKWSYKNVENTLFNGYSNMPNEFKHKLQTTEEKANNNIINNLIKFDYIDPPNHEVPHVGNRLVLCADALQTLQKRDLEPCNIITGMPDNTEMKLDYKQYEEYRHKILPLIFELGKDNVLIFTQTDKKATYNGEWFNKTNILYQYAQKYNVNLVFHEVALYANEPSFPEYQHFICFSNRLGPRQSNTILAGNKVYKNGTPFGILAKCMGLFSKFKHQLGSNIILDPFCGRGTVLAMFNTLGFETIGIDIDPEQCNYSRNMIIDMNFIKQELEILSKKEQEFLKFMNTNS